MKLIAIILGLLIFTPSVHAQLVADGATNTLSNITNTLTGNVIVGTNGSFTLLLLSNNVLVTNTSRGIIGLNTTARSNEVLLISATARWQMANTLYVGSNGPFNRLVISNGAQVIGSFLGNTGILGQNSTSSNNLAFVTGAGSLWSNAGLLNVGFSGGRNQLVVSNGARVHSVDQCYVGLSSSSDNNRVTVSGAGSLWSSDSGINVGIESTGNRLSVRDGGAVRDDTGSIGLGSGGFNVVELSGPGTSWTNTSRFEVGSGSWVNQLTVNTGAVVFAGSLGVIGTASGASLNTVTVTDPGSMWVNGGELLVGRDGPSNGLFITNGGTVTASNLFIGVQPTSTDNRLVVGGGTLRVTNVAGTSVLDVRRGTNVLSAGLVDVDRLILTNTAGRFELLGGTLLTRGAVINNGASMIVGASGGGSAFWDVQPGSLDHFAAASVIIGDSSSSNQLLVSSGARLTNSSFGIIGASAGAGGNGATITGPGSRWEPGNNFFVGSNGPANRLVVSSGATAAVSANAYLGYFSKSASNNQAWVTGPGSVWSSAGTINVGFLGAGNQVAVSNGATVTAQHTIVGAGTIASNDLALVTGAGSLWSNALNFYVGDNGPGNRLVVSDGGTVRNSYSRIGSTSSSSNNLALITDAGSLWSLAQDLEVGRSGSQNQLVVSNGAAVVAGNNGRLGAVNGATNNVVVVTGAGSMWSNQFELFVGEGGQRNRLEVNGGGWAVSSNTYVGFGGDSNLALITGIGSTLSNRADLVIGHSSANNQLVVSNGATAFVGDDAVLGLNTGASSNSVLVTDTGSRWVVATNLFVGSNAPFNRLVISNGGFVSNLRGIIGSQPAASNNVALVTGAGSVWSNRFDITIGNQSIGNRLEVKDGAQMFTGGDGFVSKDATAVSNSVLVSGPGASWIVSSNLFLGSTGAGTRLVVTNGGRAVSGFGFLEGENTEALVTGAGSLWSNRFDLHLDGSATLLSINDGGTVSGSNIFVGEELISTNNRVVVNGGVLRAANGTGTGILDVRHGTNVLNSGLVDVGTLVVTNPGTFVPAVFLPATFGNGSSNYIPFISGAPTMRANIYPSTIAVSGLAGSVSKVTVTLTNLANGRPAGLDILLVSPAGQKVMLMSDAGGSTSAGATLTFDDSAAAVIPESTLATGTYRPTDYEPGETMLLPAPAGPYATNLSVFNGSNPNGMWSLYINNSSSGFGSLLGWSVQITTDVPTIEEIFAPPAVFELNGGTLITRGAVISNDLPFIVGGPGGVPAIWETRAGLSDNFVARDLLVGNTSTFNQLVVSSGVLVANTNVIVGASPASSNNLVRVTGGTLRVLNPGTVLDVRGGTNRIDAGLVDLLHLVVTNTGGQFEMFGGTLRTPDTIISNGRVCIIGGGSSLATLQLLGGTHTFANNLTIATNGSLIGTALIDGTVTVAPGGRLTPGSPIGSMNVLGSVILQGTVNLQIDKSGGVRTSDEVIADGAIFYNGTLNVIDIGTDELAAGDRFFLFDATPYVGSFTTLNLPPLDAGLTWKNNLSFDGSIEVIAVSVSQPTITGITQSGTNLIFSGTNGAPGQNYAVLTATNVTTPAANWQSLLTNQFGAGGQFSFTNAINRNERQRYFRLRTP